MAQGGTKRALLGREAMKDIDACSLCLQHARDPRVCSEGHLYCQVRAIFPVAGVLSS